jgi:hypothetical protein
VAGQGRRPGQAAGLDGAAGLVEPDPGDQEREQVGGVADPVRGLPPAVAQGDRLVVVAA